ncbi:gns1 sur4 family protein [Cystoisospora suis]|uniref:Elongation of fatty acids protein n=1 Tax=Cystoisospora suis TaxID=483139 RepID=A0A2C6KP15_9APIC|nr:gns1 sur4 family protein [Cystoisospora suis]
MSPSPSSSTVVMDDSAGGLESRFHAPSEESLSQPSLLVFLSTLLHKVLSSASASVLPSSWSSSLSSSTSRFYELFHYYCLRPGGGGDFAALLQVPILIACALYLPVVYGLQWYMRDRRPYKMKAFCFVWNICLSVLSFLGFFIILLTQPELIPRAIYPETQFLPPVRAVICLFTLTKALEFGDTIILVLKKKPLVFLHLYHHLTVALYCWHAQLVTVSMGHNFAFINLGIHGIMYLYYAISVIAPGFYILKICRPYITILQTTQMFVGLFLSYEALVYSPHLPEREVLNIHLACIMYASYFFLFGKFFVEAYMTHLRPKTTQVVVGVHTLAIGGLWIIWNSTHPYHLLLEVFIFSSFTAVVVPLAYKAFLHKALMSQQASSSSSFSSSSISDAHFTHKSMTKIHDGELQHKTSPISECPFTQGEEKKKISDEENITERQGTEREDGEEGGAMEKVESLGCKDTCGSYSSTHHKTNNADAETDVSSTDNSPLSTNNDRPASSSSSSGSTTTTTTSSGDTSRTTAPATPLLSSSTPSTSSSSMTYCGDMRMEDDETSSILLQRKKQPQTGSCSSVTEGTTCCSSLSSLSGESLSMNYEKTMNSEDKDYTSEEMHKSQYHSTRDHFSQALLTTMNFLLAWALEAMATSVSRLPVHAPSSQTGNPQKSLAASSSSSNKREEEKHKKENDALQQDGVQQKIAHKSMTHGESSPHYHLFDALFALISKPASSPSSSSQQKKNMSLHERNGPVSTQLASCPPATSGSPRREEKGDVLLAKKTNSFSLGGPLSSFVDVVLLLVSFALPTVYGWYVHGSAILGLCGHGAFRWILELYLCHTILRKKKVKRVGSGEGRYERSVTSTFSSNTMRGAAASTSA